MQQKLLINIWQDWAVVQAFIWLRPAQCVAFDVFILRVTFITTQFDRVKWIKLDFSFADKWRKYRKIVRRFH